LQETSPTEADPSASGRGADIGPGGVLLVPAASPNARPSSCSMDVALSRFKAGASSFHSLIAELVAATEAERKTLEEARRQLEEERLAWELERQRVHTILNDVEQVTRASRPGGLGACPVSTSVSRWVLTPQLELATKHGCMGAKARPRFRAWSTSITCEAACRGLCVVKPAPGIPGPCR
jgi:hypothetical protein